MSLRGVFQILHTPFFENGDIDWASLERQIEFCLSAGVHGLTIPANASEFYTLTDDERFQVVERSLASVGGAVPVVAGVQAPTGRAAVKFAGHAADHGASAVMAMPPLLRNGSPPVIRSYYAAIADVGLATIIQNAPAPLGTPQSTQGLVDLLNSHDRISYIKEEMPPILHRISAATNLGASACKGVFGGANGLVMVEELDRGGCGNMPAGGVVDVQVKIFDAYDRGDREGAVEMQARLFPLLFHAATYGATFHKYLLWRRGILSSPTARDPQAIALDDEDVRTIEERFARIVDLTVEGEPLEPAAGG